MLQPARRKFRKEQKGRNTGTLRVTRRDIARAKTILAQKRAAESAAK